MQSKKNILIVCAHLRRDRSKRRTRDALQPIGGLHIGAMLDRDRYDVRLHHEDWHGPYDTRVVPRFDLVFLSGLQADFDRMRQLSYHFRRAGATVVAGGSICTLFPEFASRFFDVVCAGGVDSVRDVVADFEAGALRPIYRSPQPEIGDYALDYGLLAAAGITTPLHLIEASRGCSFRCSFCVIPAEGAHHAVYGLERLKRTIDNSIATSPAFSVRRWYPVIWFVDNNFSDDLTYLREVCDYLRHDRRIRSWGALVTQNVLHDRDLLRYLRRSKCRALFTGLESLDVEFLKAQNKKQNLSRRSDVVADIRAAERLGICMMYAYLFDPRIATVADMTGQIETLVGTPGLPMPSFFSFVTPLLGTRFFWQSLAAGELRPGLRLRDLDGESIAYRKLADDETRVAAFAAALAGDLGRFVSVPALARSTLHRIVSSGTRNPFYWYVFFMSNFRAVLFSDRYRRGAGRTYLAGSDPLDPQYDEYPADITPADRRTYFEAVRVLDDTGQPAAWLAPRAPGAGGEVVSAVAAPRSGAT